MASYNPKTFDKVLPLIYRLPQKGCWFDIGPQDEPLLELQAQKQEDVARLRACFPGVIWQKEYSKECAWWTYEGTMDGVSLRIYGVREAPRTCTVIQEERLVTKRVPTEFKEIQVREMVTVGWDCGEPDV